MLFISTYDMRWDVEYTHSKEKHMWTDWLKRKRKKHYVVELFLIKILIKIRSNIHIQQNMFDNGRVYTSTHEKRVEWIF